MNRQTDHAQRGAGSTARMSRGGEAPHPTCADVIAEKQGAAPPSVPGSMPSATNAGNAPRSRSSRKTTGWDSQMMKHLLKDHGHRVVLQYARDRNWKVSCVAFASTKVSSYTCLPYLPEPVRRHSHNCSTNDGCQFNPHTPRPGY
jgi:hypothetical protein